jgi:hypothetical protein
MNNLESLLRLSAKEDMQKAAIVHQNNIAKRAYPKGKLCCQKSTGSIENYIYLSIGYKYLLEFFCRIKFHNNKTAKERLGNFFPSQKKLSMSVSRELISSSLRSFLLLFSLLLLSF